MIHDTNATLDYDVLIVGGGFAGAYLARQLERRLPTTYRIALVNRDNALTYQPLLPEVVGSSLLPGHAVAPLHQIVRRSRIHVLNALDIDFDRCVLRCERDINIRYRQLVLAVGLTPNRAIIPGIAEYALPLKSLADALRLRNCLIARLEEAHMEQDPKRRRWLTCFVIIGGGFSGVEVAGEIADFLDSAHRYYSDLQAEDLRVIVVHGGEELLPELSSQLGQFARLQMQKRGIEIQLGARVAGVDQQGVVLKSGERADGGMVISAIGFTSHPWVTRLGLLLDRGRIVVNPDCSVPDRDGIWALGDCAAVINAFDGGLSPPTAQFALRQARQLADNLVRKIDGKPTQPFCYRPIGLLASIGHNKAVIQMYRLRMTGFLAWLLWRGIYLLKLPTLSRKVRVYLEWNLQMLFPPDVVSLSMHSVEAETGERSE